MSQEKPLPKGRKSIGMEAAAPLRYCQRVAAVGQPTRPVKRQPCFVRHPLHAFIHLARTRPHCDATLRNFWMSLERQFNHQKPGTAQDLVSAMRDIAKRTSEIEPM